MDSNRRDSQFARFPCVLDHPHQHFFRTKQQKLEYFRDTLHLSLDKLPSLDLVTPTAGKHRCYFPDRFPISILPETEKRPRRISFCFVDDGIEILGPLWRFLLRHEQLLRSLPSSEIVYMWPRPGGILSMPTACSPVLFQSSTLPLSRRASARLAFVTSLPTSKRVRFLKKLGWRSPEFLRKAGPFTKRLLTIICLFDSWVRDDITDEEIVARYSEKRINISVRGYVICAAFPQNGPKYRGAE